MIRLRVRGPSVSWPWALVWLAVVGIARAAWWLLRRPGRLVTVTVIFCAVFALNTWGPYWLCITVFAAVYTAAVWGEVWPASFDRFVELPARAWWRKRWVFRRNWGAAMTVTGLAREDGALPRLGRVRCTETADMVQVRAVLGQRPQEWVEAAPYLAQLFGASACRVHRGGDRRLTLELRRRTDRSRSWGGPAPSSGVPGRGTVGGVSAGWGEGGDRG